MTRIVNISFSLYVNMDDINNFASEISHIKFFVQELGVKVYPTPQYHSKIAEDEIEYIWSLYKEIYCSKPLKLKKGKAQFKN